MLAENETAIYLIKILTTSYSDRSGMDGRRWASHAELSSMDSNARAASVLE
jgi:hypothetical protein